jgi:hypothetical protein
MKYLARYCHCLVSVALCMVSAITTGAVSGQGGTGTERSNRNVTVADRPSQLSLPNGTYYALVIGNNNYRYVPHLRTAVSDAQAVADVLEKTFGFKVTLKLDASRQDIFQALVGYRRELPENSSLLIYYAGHGNHDRDTDEAYWLPVDARPDNPENWVSADDITRNIRAIPAKHILIISDSCYSGVLARDAPADIEPEQREAYLNKMQVSKSRNLMSSGSDEPVSDAGSAGHSVFAKALLDAFDRVPYSRFAAGDLFQQFVQPSVAGQSSQLPQYSVIRESGHDFGDFVFTRVGADIRNPTVSGPTTVRNSRSTLAVVTRTAPPPLPIYAQPVCPGPGHLWTPGYWAWNENGGYYWVPGTWVVAPVGLLWTPGFWESIGGTSYLWHSGYWGPHIGFYGGINYGFGYRGVGFVGGEWRDGAFYYNRSVTNVSVTNVPNVYNKTAVSAKFSPVAFNGGEGGIVAHPTLQEEAAEHEQHTATLPAQTQHELAASLISGNFASENHGRPPVAATVRPGEFSGNGAVAARAAGESYHPSPQH